MYNQPTNLPTYLGSLLEEFRRPRLVLVSAACGVVGCLLAWRMQQCRAAPARHGMALPWRGFGLLIGAGMFVASAAALHCTSCTNVGAAAVVAGSSS